MYTWQISGPLDVYLPSYWPLNLYSTVVKRMWRLAVPITMTSLRRYSMWWDFLLVSHVTVTWSLYQWCLKPVTCGHHVQLNREGLGRYPQDAWTRHPNERLWQTQTTVSWLQFAKIHGQAQYQIRHDSIPTGMYVYVCVCVLANVCGLSLHLWLCAQLSRFLVMDPNKRITSEVAMADTYFSEDPKPCLE